MEEKKGKLNLLSCIVIIVSGMIGSAIFSLSGLTIQLAGPSAILSWAIAAAIMLFYGLFMCELATFFPESGGAFYFPYMALGKNEKQKLFFGYISALAYIVSNITAIAFSASYVGTYLEVGFDFLKNKQIIISLIVVLFAYFYNTLDIKKANVISTILTIILFVTLVFFIIACLKDDKFDIFINKSFFSDGTIKKFGFLTAIPTAMVGYGSITAMSYMVSDVDNKKKTLPKAAVISMAIVALLYCLSIFAIIGMTTSKELTESNMTFIPFFAVCFMKLQNIPYLSKIVSLSATLALITTVVVMVSLTSRAIQQLAYRDIVIDKLGEVNNKNVPANASLFICIIVAILLIIPNLTETLVTLGALLNVIHVLIHLFSLYAVRQKYYYNDKIYKAPGGNILIFAIMTIIILCYIPDIVSGGYKIWLFTILLYIIGIIYYKKRVK